MKKYLFVFLGLSVLLGGGLYGSENRVEAQSQTQSQTQSRQEGIEPVEPFMITGSMKIEGKNYKWREASFGGTNRGYEINPGKHRYQLSPNPHNDPWYNKNQAKFYGQGAAQIEKQANSGKWHSKGWPSTIRNVTIHGINYTLTK